MKTNNLGNLSLPGLASLALGVSIVASAANAQTGPEAAALDAQRAAVNAALLEAAEGASRSAIVLPVAALEVPAVAQSYSAIAMDPETGIAIEGFDPVGYFTEGKAMRGSAEYSAEYEGAMFYFANEAHQKLFIASPEKYIPAYGGYCTETLAAGAFTPASPVHWTVHGDRLYLTRSAGANDTFRSHRAQSIESADAQFALAENFLDSYNFSATSN